MQAGCDICHALVCLRSNGDQLRSPFECVSFVYIRTAFVVAFISKPLGWGRNP